MSASDSADLDEAVSRVEHELGRLFSRIRVSWREAAITVHPDLQPLGYQVLTSIATGKATSAGAIIERLQTDKSAVSRQVRQLEQLGLVESVRDPDDRRARVLVATELAQERELNAAGRARVPVIDEQLNVGKRAIERGGVRVFTRVVEQPVEESITLREERATVRRVAADRPATEADLAAATGGTIEVRETVDEPVVQKVARVVEEIEVGKEVEERTETIRDTVRHTEVQVDEGPGPRGARMQPESRPDGRR